MSLDVSWDDIAGPITRKLYVEGVLQWTETASFDPRGWSWYMLDTAGGSDGTITDLVLTGLDGTVTWSGGDVGEDGRVDVSVLLPLTSGPRLVRFANGAEMVARSGAIWRRDTWRDAWAEAETLTDTAPVIMPGVARVGAAVCLDDAALHSASAGNTWSTSPPANVLPDEVAAWPRGDTGLCDMQLGEDGSACGSALDGSDLVAYVTGQDPATLAMLAAGTYGGPTVARDAQGRWHVGVLVDGTWREWVSGEGMTWSELSSQSKGSGAAWSQATVWVGANGAHLLAGWHPVAEEVRAMWRSGFGATWSTPATIAAPTSAVAPYAMQAPTGAWEIGWYDGSDWTRYRAATPGGTWAEVTP